MQEWKRVFSIPQYLISYLSFSVPEQSSRDLHPTVFSPVPFLSGCLHFSSRLLHQWLYHMSSSTCWLTCHDPQLCEANILHICQHWNQIKVLKNQEHQLSSPILPITVMQGHLAQGWVDVRYGWFLGSPGNQSRKTGGPLKTGSSWINILPGREGGVTRHRQTFVETTIPLCVCPLTNRLASFWFFWDWLATTHTHTR